MNPIRLLFRPCPSVLGALLLLLVGPAAEGQQLHVAPHGDDSAAGTAAEPLATLNAARDRLRALRRAGPAQIVLHAGVYELAETIDFGAADSSPAAPLTVCAAPGAEVRLVGGKQVRSWSELALDPLAVRLAPAARANVRCADLRAAGVTDFGQLERRSYELPQATAGLELFTEEGPAQLARWPNHGWATVDRSERRGEWLHLASGAQRPAAWRTSDGVWLHGFWKNDWCDSHEPLTAADAPRGLFTLAATQETGHIRPGARFAVLNALEELDQPGEWYLDRARGRLYFWPPGELRDLAPRVSTLDSVLAIYGAHDFTLRGLTVECARGVGVEVAGGARVTLADCTLRHCGNSAVNLYYGVGHKLSSCRIAHTGDAAVRLEGGDRAALARCDFVVEHCELSHFGRWRQAYSPGVEVHGVGATLRHNRIAYGPHAAVLLAGNEHLVELNEVHHVCRETHDVGAVYLSHDWTARGNVIRHNHFHDLGGFSPTGVVAVYLDDFASGAHVTGNLFERAGRAVVIGGGRDNRVENNIIVASLAGVQIDARGRTWAQDQVLGEQAPLPARLREASAAQHAAYPALRTLAEDEPTLPKGNIVARNICRCEHPLELFPGVSRAWTVVERNLIGEDPQFLAEDRGDLRLSPTSPAWQLGFEPLPLEHIGPRPAAAAQQLAAE